MEQTSELIDRIVQLERQQAEVRRTNRRLELLAGALVLLIGSVLVMGQTNSVHSIEARQFVLRDDAGVVRGALGLGDNGAVGINLNDIKGRPRISLDIASNGTPGLDFYDATGKLRATFALGPEGTPVREFAAREYQGSCAACRLDRTSPIPAFLPAPVRRLREACR